MISKCFSSFPLFFFEISALSFDFCPEEKEMGQPSDGSKIKTLSYNDWKYNADYFTIS